MTLNLIVQFSTEVASLRKHCKVETFKSCMFANTMKMSRECEHSSLPTRLDENAINLSLSYGVCDSC